MRHWAGRALRNVRARRRHGGQLSTDGMGEQRMVFLFSQPVGRIGLQWSSFSPSFTFSLLRCNKPFHRGAEASGAHNVLLELGLKPHSQRWKLFTPLTMMVNHLVVIKMYYNVAYWCICLINHRNASLPRAKETVYEKPLLIMKKYLHRGCWPHISWYQIQNESCLDLNTPNDTTHSA